MNKSVLRKKAGKRERAVKQCRGRSVRPWTPASFGPVRLPIGRFFALFRALV